ncbi:hypothetical protein SMACR_01494 [Sordaria macrospora]|uniref:protein disulfide-isomerase n=2 Tax=Sordaria macrospora TaxID=5147 RepID=F7VQZ8_SORMK|nr:uncharacterized protein SMAC_01494 [Sordaria macrospora k-hell]KAA8629133.1 hypothetical protein SMACR_01494 [Sordaria macrospora]WPJ58620.1 hypothetical protein SMAC4_01494 [Sordaria macrospora]CCC07931.1 unnamed protein product [Sordaria macrospora k-hell]
MHHPTLCALAVGILSALPGAQAGLYTKKSPVLQVDGKDYDRLIAKSNQTTIVEFYAPWCGHCQNLKPAYEKAAKNLEGLAKVAAVNCDDDANKPFCGSMGVKGFPTLKIVRPGKKAGSKPVVEDYQGQRTASAIVDAVVSRINNHVVKVEDKNLDNFLSDKNETAKALLFTDKGTTSALLKSVAIDFLDVITVGQVRNTQSKAVSTFGVDKFPTLILLPGGDAPGLVYDGEIKKAAMVKFLSQAGQPNPDPAPAKAKNGGKKDSKKTDSSKKAASSSSTKSKSSETSTFSSSETAAPTQEAPVIINTALPIPTLNTPEKLTKECLTSKSNTCVLAFVSSSSGDKSQKALANLAELAFKHAHSNRKLFPFYEVPLASNPGGSALLASLGLDVSSETSDDIQIIAINARRGWWRHYDSVSISDDFSGHDKLEAWIDAIRMGEGTKKKVPEGVVVDVSQVKEESESKAEKAKPEEAVAEEETTPEATKAVPTADGEEAPVTPEASEATAAAEGEEEESTAPVDPTPEPETAAAHDEL